MHAKCSSVHPVWHQRLFKKQIICYTSTKLSNFTCDLYILKELYGISWFACLEIGMNSTDLPQTDKQRGKFTYPRASKNSLTSLVNAKKLEDTASQNGWMTNWMKELEKTYKNKTKQKHELLFLSALDLIDFYLRSTTGLLNISICKTMRQIPWM